MSSGAHRARKKRWPDALELELMWLWDARHGWEPNSGSLQEQPMLLTAIPSLQLWNYDFNTLLETRVWGDAQQLKYLLVTLKGWGSGPQNHKWNAEQAWWLACKSQLRKAERQGSWEQVGYKDELWLWTLHLIERYCPNNNVGEWWRNIPAINLGSLYAPASTLTHAHMLAYVCHTR